MKTLVIGFDSVENARVKLEGGIPFVENNGRLTVYVVAKLSLITGRACLRTTPIVDSGEFVNIESAMRFAEQTAKAELQAKAAQSQDYLQFCFASLDKVREA